MKKLFSITQSINQSINHSIIQSINQSINHSIIQSILFQELDDTMSEIKKRANHVRTNLKTMELAIEEQEKTDKTRFAN